MTDKKETYMTIYKNGHKLLNINRDSIAEVKETHDGFTINLKSTIHVYISDPYMSLETKNKIITSDRFPNANINVDLSNPGVPVTVLPV